MLKPEFDLMANTHCKNCMFSREADSSSPCEFNLIDIIKNKKELSIIDNFFYIKDYKCAYGFSENIYQTHPELQKNVNIKDYVLDQAKISYYLIIDIRLFSTDELIQKINTIKELDIKPKFISLITSTQQNTKDIILKLQKQLDKTKIDWKIHSFLNTISFNDCINIAADTTINSIENIQYMVLDDGTPYSISINNIINHAHYVFKIIQDNIYCIATDKESLHMMSMYVSLYKSVISTIGKDIINGINSIPNLNIGSYDIEKSK